MAISEDASTPAVVTSAADTTGIITSASFSPPAGSLLVVLAAITFNGGSQASSATVKDSASNAFTAGPSVNTSGHDTNAGIWTRYYSSAPGSITVTVTDTNTAQAARMLAVRVVNGAASSQSGAGSATTSAAPGDNATHDCTGNITTTAAGSWVYAVVADGTNAGSSTVTPDSGTATLPGGVLPWNDATDEVTSVAGTQSPQATGTPGSTPVGWTISATYWWAWAALEILPASATTASAGLAAATGRALNPSVSTSGGTTAVAGLAAGTGTAQSPSAAITVHAGLAAGTGTAQQPSVSGGPVAVVNQWANSYGQGTGFTSITSALQSCVVQLDGTYNVGAGSGTPSAGTWLFVIASWTQDPAIQQVHVGVSDDIHSYWREYPASNPAGNVRTSISFTPNTARAPGYIYVAPDGEIAAVNVLVVEVSGLGPWDTVVGPVTNYAGAATSLTLALGAPGAAAFWIAGVGGDSTAASQAFAPAGWTTLHTLSQSDGSDQLASNYLTSAYLASSSSSQSVSASASSTDLSGFMLAVWTAGTNPVPAGQNPDWPLLKFEMAPGAGFNTPDSEITTGNNANPLNWVDLSTRLWDWDETTGIQFQLGQLQSTQLTIELDNYDGALITTNPGSPYYSNALNSNMSFQARTSPWTATGSAALAHSSAQTYASGNGAGAQYSLQVTPNGSTASPGAISEQESVTASTAYSASAWFYSVAGYSTGAQVAITWYTSAHASISTVTSTALAIPAATWTQVTFLAQSSPSNAAYAAITVQFSGTPSATAFWVAEAALVPGSAAVLTGLVQPGTPLRIRAALGTIGGVTVNRWYVIQRNAGEWTEKIDETLRRYVQVTCTDIWAALSATPPTFYRSEIYQDAPYAWWPCDDQPGTAGVLPVALLNAAVGNTNTLNVELSPNGGASQAYLSEAGASTATATTTTGYPPGIAVYTVGADAGWMFGDPQGTPASLGTGNPVTSTPGSAAWQASGQAGSTGSYGWYLICNDSSFPALSGGVTIEIWFNATWYGTSNAWSTGHSSGGTTNSPITAQPYDSPVTLWEIATSSAPVCLLQLDASGHLNLITEHSGSPTSHSIYTASDLRSDSWHMVTVTLTTTTWQVWLDGGANANASGTATGMTSAWTYLIANGDFGSSGGSSPSSLVHGGNIALSHLAVYPVQLPYYRVLDHYWAAATAFGQLPAPTGVQVAWTQGQDPLPGEFSVALTSDFYTADGSAGGTSGGYTSTSGTGISVIVAATAPGSVTSGPSAWTASETSYYTTTPITIHNVFPWISWTGVAPGFNVYTASALGSEAEAAVVSGSGDAFTGGYGGSATGVGVAQTAGGSGASPPTTPSAIGDTVGQRIERLMRAGLTTSPNRCIDPASLLVQAPGSVGGGVQAGAAIQAIEQSDSGFLYVDSLNNLVYWQRPHLAGQYSSPVWQLGPGAGQIPYWRELNQPTDPQRVWNVITVSPLSPTGASLPSYTPANATAVDASQVQYGAQPYPVTSWLQSSTEQQAQATWLFDMWGVPRRRAENVKVDAASNPAQWILALGINVADVATMQDWQLGGGGTTYTYRTTQFRRHIEFGGPGDREAEAGVWLQLDWEPPEYFS